MNKKLWLIGALMSVSTMLFAGKIVSGGVPTDEAFADLTAYESRDGSLVGSGGGNLLYSRNLYRGDVTVEAELALDKLNGSAASIFVQGVNWGFDGGRDKKPFVESSTTISRSLNTDNVALEPGRFFKVRIESRGGRQRCLIDGKVLTEDIPVPSDRNGEIYLRPHRNVMRVRDFSVDGEVGGVLPKSLETPVCGSTFALGKNFEWRISGGGFVEGEAVELTISTGKNGVKSTATASASDRLSVPAAALEEAYRLADGKHNARRLELSITGKDKKIILVVTDPNASGDFMRGSIVKFGDRTRIAYNGKPDGTIVGYEGHHSSTTALADARTFAGVGIHDAVVLLEPFRYIDAEGNFDLDSFLRNLDSVAAKLIACDPDVRFKPYILSYMSPDWCRRHPEELIVLDNGVETLLNTPEHVRQPSLASEVWTKRMGEILFDIVSALRKGPFADRIGYCRVRGGNSGEWNHFGYHEKAFVDFSEPMRRAFAAWLKRRYGTAENLSKAWERPGIDFDSPGLLPTREARLNGGPVYRAYGAVGQQCVDYYEFFQELTARTILRFASIIKTASDHRLLTSAYYGYYFGHYGNNPYHFQDSGHYGVRYILNSLDLDICSGPYIYPARRFIIEVNGITGSYPLRNKLWESEEDLRTSRSGASQKPYGAHDDPVESTDLIKRDYIMNLARRSTMYFYDFAQDWYSDPLFVYTVKRLLEIDRAFFSLPPRSVPEVGVIFDEEGIPRLTNQPKSVLKDRWLKWRWDISRWAVPTSFYYKTDLAWLDPKKTPILVYAEELPSEAEQKKLKARGFTAILPLELEAKDMRTHLFKLRKTVHVYGSGNHGLADTFIATPLLGIFTRGGGKRKVWLPQKVEVVADLFSGETWYDCQEFEYPVKRKPETRIFFFGTRREYQAFKSKLKCEAR